MHIGLLLRSIGASWREWNFYAVPGFFRSFLDRCVAAENDQVRQRDSFSAASIGLRAVEFLLNCFQLLQDLPKLCRLIDLPIFLRCETNASSVRAAAFV